MSLLRDIQTSLLTEGSKIGPILLKLRYLASKLGSRPLEDWVKFESEGYPVDVALPTYRRVQIAYRGTFSGPFGSGIRNAPIPPYLVEKFAGENWRSYQIRQSVSAIEELLAQSNEFTLEVDLSNLILVLQGKLYEDYACNSITGIMSKSSLNEIQNSVRTRILELSIKIESEIPMAMGIELGSSPQQSNEVSGRVSQVTNNVVYGNVTTISGTGENARINIRNSNQNIQEFVSALASGGIPVADAEELAAIILREPAGSVDEPLGPDAKNWFVRNISKAVDGTWKIGIGTASNLISEAVLRFYGIK